MHRETLPEARYALYIKALKPQAVLSSEDVNAMVLRCRDDSAPFEWNTTTSPSHEICYVAFTSGTTGSPKGVLVRHSNIEGYAKGRIGLEELKEGAKVLLASAATFDPSQGDVYAVVLSGATLCVPPLGSIYASPDEILHRFAPTHITTTPLLWATVQSEPEDLPFLRYVCLGGEATPAAVQQKWGAPNTPLIVRNVYGVTEATCYQMYCPISTTVFTESQVYPGCTISICEDHLLLRGSAVAESYFVADGGLEGVQSVTTNGWHDTGDLVEKLQNGSFQLIGRIPTEQTKLNGRRVTLLEISDAASRLNSVVSRHATILYQHRPVLFLQPISEPPPALLKEVTSFVLKRHVSTFLLPSEENIRVATIPITVNGKVDHSVLHSMLQDDSRPAKRAKILEEHNPTEAKVLSLWRDELGQSTPLGLDSEWGSAGGDSLSLLRLVHKMRTAFAADVGPASYTKEEASFGTLAGPFQPAEFLQRQTIRLQAEYIASALNVLGVRDAPQQPQPQHSPPSDGCSLLKEVCRSGESGLVAVLLSEGVDVDGGVSRKSRGMAPLHYAAQNGHTKIVALLLEKGATPTCVTEVGVTPAHLAAGTGHVEGLEMLFATKKVNPLIKDANKQTLHHFAARSGEADTTRYLMELNVPLAEYDRWGRSPLHWAVVNGHNHEVALLIELGLAVNETRTLARKTRLEKEMPLDIALRMHPTNLALAELLKAAGAVTSK